MIDSEIEEEEELIKPHPAQIVAILLLTTKSYFEQQYRSKLAQILTGEGKSLVLATLGIYYAHLGYDVKVACYSAYLCSRDF